MNNTELYRLKNNDKANKRNAEKRANGESTDTRKQVYALDVETSKDIDAKETWIYSWMTCAITLVEKRNWWHWFDRGTDVESLVDWLQNLEGNPLIYVHNLKFDISFIICELERRGCSFTTEKNPDETEYTSLVTENTQFYNFKMLNKKGTVVEFYDFYKICPMSLEDVANGLHLPVGKGEYDYSDRPRDYEMTEEDWNYLYKDVYILGMAVKIFRKLELTEMTIGSCAMKFYKSLMSKAGHKWENVFPPLGEEVDAFCREAYKGGLVFCQHPEKVFENVQHGDYNSAYPAHMRNQLLPFGEAKHFTGEPNPTNNWPLFIVKIRLQASLKVEDGHRHVPGLIFKEGLFSAPGGSAFIENTDPLGDIMTVTSVDLETLYLVYDVHKIEYIEGYKFRGSHDLHYGYVDHWNEQKMKGKREKNAALVLVAKFMLNSLTGKFAGRLAGRKKCISVQDGVINFIQPFESEMTEYYVPFVAFITAYQRNTLIKDTVKNFPRVLYGDTDSIFVVGKLEAEWFDDKELGAMAIEHEHISRAKFIRGKCYYLEIMEEGELKTEVTCAGMSKKYRQDKKTGNALMSLEEFDYGYKSNKLIAKQWKGGVVLLDGQYEIKRIGGTD